MIAVLALAAATLVGQVPRPELVTLPLSSATADGQPSLAGWNAVVRALERQTDRLNVSMRLQKSQHDFLVGPAREQAEDCGRDVDCLAEIGAALGADLLVVGVMSQRVALLAIRVPDRAVLAKARSRQTGSVSAKAKRAAQRLARRLTAALARAEAPAVAEPAAGAEAASGRADDTGLLYIHRNQLAGVTRLTLDGDPVSFTGEGFVSTPAPSGQHTLRAVHVDGRVITRIIDLRAGRTTEIELPFITAAAPTPLSLPAAPALDSPVDDPRASELVRVPPARTRQDDDDGVFGSWWFWTVVGSAVVAGATTATLLASGNKGGPTPSGETGSIQGSY